jgi:hypothetical protein
MKKFIFTMAFSFAVVLATAAQSTGGNVTVEANLSAIPFHNLVVLCIFALLAVAGLIVGGVWAIKTLKIKKIGNIDILEETKKAYEHYNHMASCQHFMDDEIHDVDDGLRAQLQEIAQSTDLHTMNVLRGFLKSGLLQETLTAYFSLILTTSVIKNHFTKELMPDRYKGYRDRIITQFEDRYRDAYSRVSDMETKMPTWDDAKDTMISIVDNWLLRVKEAVKSSCDDKIEIYSRYALRFKDDEHRAGIIQECIDKNKKYISNLS